MATLGFSLTADINKKVQGDVLKRVRQSVELFKDRVKQNISRVQAEKMTRIIAIAAKNQLLAQGGTYSSRDKYEILSYEYALRKAGRVDTSLLGKRGKSYRAAREALATRLQVGQVKRILELTGDLFEFVSNPPTPIVSFPDKDTTNIRLDIGVPYTLPHQTGAPKIELPRRQIYPEGRELLATIAKITKLIKEAAEKGK